MSEPTLENHVRWLGLEDDPHDALGSFQPELMRMWPISNRVNTPKNDDPSLLDPVPELAA